MSYPRQHHGDYPPGYTQQPTQQPIEDSDEDLDEDLNEFSDESSDGYSDGYSDGFPDEDPGRYPDRSLQDYPLEPLDEPSVGSYINDLPEQLIEDQNRHPYRASEAHQAQGNYSAAGTAPATQAFRSLGLTSFDAQPGPSQTDATSQAAGAWYGDHERPPFPHPDSNPYGQVALNIIGFERTRFEPPYSEADNWWLRTSIANGYGLEYVARTLQRTTESVADFVSVHKLALTDEQKAELSEMNVGDHPDTSYARQHPDGSESRDGYEILDRAKYQEPSAETPQPGSQQYPTGFQPAGPVAPRATRSNKPWDEDDLRQLQDFRARHGSNWNKFDNEVPGRSKSACQNKWQDLQTHGHRHLELRESEGVIQRFPGDESGDQEPRPKRVEDLNDRDLDLIKRRLARDTLMADMISDRYRGFRQRTIIKFVYLEGGWKPWAPEEDETLLRMLSPEGDEWSEISKSKKPIYPPRSKEEIEVRWEYVRRVKNGEQARKTRASAYTFEEEDDNYIRLGCAQGMRFTQMCNEEFPDLSSTSVGRHAKLIGAVWEAAHDLRLLSVNLEPGAPPDFASIGQWWNPLEPLHPDLVRARWDFLHSEKYAKRSRSRHRRGH